MKPTPLLRSVLYLPASNQRAIEKSRGIDADAIVFDLEDSVAPSAKQGARQSLVHGFEQGNFGRSLPVIRINSIGSGDYLKDLEVVAQCRPTAVMLPKVSSTADVQTFERDAVKHGLPGDLNAWYMIETVAGIVNLAQLTAAGSDSRYKLQCLVVGHNDLASETGVSLAENRRYLLPWLMQVILQAKHNSIGVLDSVWNNFKDTDGLRAECAQGRAMGFTGKTLIHPVQVAIANEQFSPGDDEIARAREIIRVYQLPENEHAGVINVDGEMIERLHLEQARVLLEQLDKVSAG